ncbi:TorF family putative porin [Pseudomonas sp. NPDC007930]|uniref:TorF family putative porin n=1 Tax=Pseudomonas sp. NPDC007930 TaxID=3364417 RepID=UPI0036EA0C11
MLSRYLPPRRQVAAPLFLLALAPAAHAQLMQREMGDFDLTLGTTPSRTMAQGLVTPSTGTAVHGGLDLTHDSGFYVGQWAPSLGLTSTSTLEVDSYAGYKRKLSPALGYEVGVMSYTRPKVVDGDSHELYAGLRLLGTRFGAALSEAIGSRASTLYADFGALPLLNLGLSMKVTNYQLSTPYDVGDGNLVSGYNDWSMTLTRPYRGVDLDFTYTDSDLSGGRCAAYAGHNPECGGTFTLKAVRSFF